MAVRCDLLGNLADGSDGLSEKPLGRLHVAFITQQ